MELYEKSKAKDILTDKKLLNETIRETIERMAKIVGATLGPGGRGVLIEREGLAPLVTKDGVTVAKSLGLSDADANIIIEACKEICLNTAKEAGDGTTTAIVLANAILKAGQSFVSSQKKYNAQRLVRELEDLFYSHINPYITQRSRKLEGEKQLLHTAIISANGDKRIAEAVSKAIQAAGDDGTILIEEDQGRELRVETIEGYVITTGLNNLGQIGPVFINDRANQQVKMDGGLVFLYDGTINDKKVLAYLQDALQPVDAQGRVTPHDGSPVIIIAHDFADAVKDELAKMTKSGMTFCPVLTPRYGHANGRSMFLQDMAAYTSARVFDPGDIGEIDKIDLGEFTNAKSNLYETFIEAEPDAEDVDARVEELKSIEASAHSDFDRMHIRAAIAKLTGGISTIYVGGVSDLEIREKKARVEDAVEAVRSAIAEGVVPGGCALHLELIEFLRGHSERKESWRIMEEALSAPFKLLLENCGENYDEIIKNLEQGKVFDAERHEFVNPIENGIIEPAKVVRVSVANALSVASLLMTLGGIVVTPRNSDLEAQMEMSKQAFSQMMETTAQ